MSKRKWWEEEMEALQGGAVQQTAGSVKETEVADVPQASAAQVFEKMQQQERPHAGNYRFKKRLLTDMQQKQGNRFVSDMISRQGRLQQQEGCERCTEEAEVSPTYAPQQEGGWLGDASGCTADDQTKINAAMNHVNGIVNNWNLPNLNRLKTALSNKLSSITIDCHGSGCEGLYGHAPRGGDSLTICQAALDASQDRLNAVVFHELIHSCGGTELDSEALENHYFSGSGATAPTSGDFEKFTDDGGNFTILDPETGEVYEKKTDGTRGNKLNVTAADFKPPDSGGW